MLDFVIPKFYRFQSTGFCYLSRGRVTTTKESSFEWSLRSLTWFVGIMLGVDSI